ncbi:hypothetical protein [Desulfobacter latus]|uniref:Uncharacterized protein n=1 Tax=Desulfobacter latus TaxID=2292 RepID=A0A850SYL0_9BACT|nr:hypothetical protein [Desulfobacter latus]NWH06394.1 hypothetical protein [Desulfobacter latus]
MVDYKKWRWYAFFVWLKNFIDQIIYGLDHHWDHRVGWVERSETQHFVFVGFRSSTQPTFHALAEIMIKALFIPDNPAYTYSYQYKLQVFTDI